LALAAGVLGCGSSGPQRASVAGEVTLNGSPIEQGTITFVPASGNAGPTAGGAIIDGKYNVPKAVGPLVGRQRVELRAWRKTGVMIPNPMSAGAMMEEKVEAFGAEFNDQSTLERDVASGHNVFDFALESVTPMP
jgi:hypothetical protein